MSDELMTFEAKIILEDGTTVYASVEAEDRQEAKFEFAHAPTVTIGDEVENIARVDYRSVRQVRRARAA